MKTYLQLQRQRGASAIIIALLLGIFVALVAMVVDVGYGVVVSQELNHASDAAALHGARQLATYYKDLSYDEQENFVLSAAQEAEIRNVVMATAASNKAGGKSVVLDPADIQIGQWDGVAKKLTVTNVKPTGVEVLSRRDNQTNGPISTFFAKIMGINEFSVRSIFNRNGGEEIPTAALTGVGYVAPGQLELPIGISEQWFRDKETFCDQPLKFFPTNTPEGCAGWHTFDLSPANASTARQDILDPMLEGTFEGPEVYAGSTTLEFIGGNVASALSDLKEVYDARKNEDGEWESYVVVYQSDDCSNPSGPLIIVGFASVVVTHIGVPPELQEIDAHVKCDLIQPDSRGGGANFGTLGDLPNLVQ